MHKIFSTWILLILALNCQSQMPPLSTHFPDLTFKNYQLSFDRVRTAYQKNEAGVRKMFEEKKINYPCSNILIRGFKGSNDFEIWGRNSLQDTFILIKNYKICALSGILGPKRYEGDRQVPEGFYFLSDFKPNSEYHLSMLVNYPNYSDLIAGDKNRPGGDIYIHGACMTVGCMPMTNELIEDI